MNFRQHQRDLWAICDRILEGAPIKRILCGVTPGGGKSLLPQILAHRLIPAIADKLCWIVPRLALQDQGARGFHDPAHRNMIGHRLEAMSSTNVINPTRGHAAYVTTYQAIGADKRGLNAQEFKKHRYILVLDEPHHVEESSVWHEALQPLLERAALVCLMSGTFERGDGAPIAGVPYLEADDGMAIDWRETPEQAVIQYSLRDAWREQAVIDLEVRYVDCAATWRDGVGVTHAVKSLAKASERETAPALYTALHSEAALELLSLGVRDWRAAKSRSPRSKLLVVAATIEQAKRYRDWMDAHGVPVKIATSDDSAAAQAAITAFKRHGHGAVDCLMTVAMAYEGLDVPAITHLICLTHIRTKPWIEQVIHRATRVDYAAGPYESQRAVIYAPDDAPFRSCVQYLLAQRDAYRACWVPHTEPREPLPAGDMDLFGGQGLYPGLEVVGSSVVGVRQDDLLAQVRARLQASVAVAEPETPADRLTRKRKAIEQYCRRQERRQGLQHGTVNRAVFKQFKKSRAAMTEAELDRVLVWLDRQYAREAS